MLLPLTTAHTRKDLLCTHVALRLLCENAGDISSSDSSSSCLLSCGQLLIILSSLWNDSSARLPCSQWEGSTQACETDLRRNRPVMQKGRDWIFSCSEMIRLFFKGLACVWTVRVQHGPARSLPHPHLSALPCSTSQVPLQRTKCDGEGGKEEGQSSGERRKWSRDGGHRCERGLRSTEGRGPSDMTMSSGGSTDRKQRMAFGGNPSRVGGVPGAV